MPDDDGILFSCMNDVTDFAVSKAVRVVSLPRGLGAVTAMRILNGRIVCKTESGVEFVMGVSTEGDNGHDDKSKI